jgi:2-C-methyl-D-erythritol 4-phosphate cytidylyltransferase
VQHQYVIILAGGTGSRMKSDIPKQFIELQGAPIIIHSLKRFINYNLNIQIIICVHKNYKSHLENIIQKFNLETKNIQIVFGGDTRFQSVKNGLNLIQDLDAVVGIHDSARPFVSLKTIQNCFETAAIKGNAIPCISINESLRKISNNINSSINRNEYKIIQTPQCFLVSKIKKAFEQEYNFVFTDDATVLETIGEKIVLVEGNEENIKITSPHDLLIAKALIHEE